VWSYDPAVISSEARNLSAGKLPVMREHQYFVYILTNWNNRVMYVGMTNNLARRLHEHRTHAVKGFTEKYNVHKLVYFEETTDVHSAMAREREIKKWRREKKNALVIQANLEWLDLGNELDLHASPSVNSTRM
jgi:putative endonuclease